MAAQVTRVVTWVCVVSAQEARENSMFIRGPAHSSCSRPKDKLVGVITTAGPSCSSKLRCGTSERHQSKTDDEGWSKKLGPSMFLLATVEKRRICRPNSQRINRPMDGVVTDSWWQLVETDGKKKKGWSTMGGISFQ